MDTTEARDLISQAVTDAWVAYTPEALLVDTLFFQDRKKKGPPEDPEAIWARLVIKHTGGGNPTLSGGIGLARYERRLLIQIQLFTPFNDGLASSDAISQYLVEVFQGKAFNNLWFRDIFSEEIGNDGLWYQVNISITGTYDQLK